MGCNNTYRTRRYYNRPVAVTLKGVNNQFNITWESKHVMVIHELVMKASWSTLEALNEPKPSLPQLSQIMSIRFAVIRYNYTTRENGYFLDKYILFQSKQFSVFHTFTLCCTKLLVLYLKTKTVKQLMYKCIYAGLFCCCFLWVYNIHYPS